jgi:hypothetical protein
VVGLGERGDPLQRVLPEREDVGDKPGAELSRARRLRPEGPGAVRGALSIGPAYEMVAPSKMTQPFRVGSPVPGINKSASTRVAIRNWNPVFALRFLP